MTFPIPLSTLMVTLTAVGVGLVSNLLTRRFVDLNAERRIKAELNAFNAELKAAVRAKDKEKEQRLRKKEQQMAQMRLKISSGRTKISVVTIVPFLAVYYGLSALMGGLGVTVAYSPVPLCIPSTVICLVGQNGAVSLFWWYFLSSLTFTGILTRLLGTAT
jgi:uncharacterized membrane protein (DUF106 family)